MGPAICTSTTASRLLPGAIAAMRSPTTHRTSSCSSLAFRNGSRTCVEPRRGGTLRESGR
eukprot:3957581-Prymnesium_polylepis.1